MACSIVNMMDSMSIDEKSLLEDVIKKLDSMGVNTKDGVLRVNIQENRGGAFASLIYDCKTKIFLKSYPIEKAPESAEKKKMAGGLIISYYENQSVEMTSDVSKYRDCQAGDVFCCDILSPYKKIRTEKDNLFNGFMNRRGTFDQVFEVTRQVDNGPDIGTKYYKLKEGIRKELDVNNSSSFNKVHSFQNYKCTKHGLFFKVNLYSEKPVYNRHHMRPNPTSNINTSVLNQFINMKEF
eukprot:GFUD01009465.1.p1 GENE.GFUD01009465.1~~GFUD01009465.1.p1  ORF type:complete len:238 (+),score=66.09 GFUD01009465.1:91-804(+)